MHKGPDTPVEYGATVVVGEPSDKPKLKKYYTTFLSPIVEAENPQQAIFKMFELEKESQSKGLGTPLLPIETFELDESGKIINMTHWEIYGKPM